MMKKTIADFRSSIKDFYTPFLSLYNFKVIKRKTDKDGYTIIYRRDHLYINIALSLDYRDSPYNVTILLGEGSIDMPERDWNSVNLSQFIKQVNHTNEDVFYCIEKGMSLEMMQDSVLGSLSDLKEYGISFLKKDLTLFYQIRKEMNLNREPYKLYCFDEGNFIELIEEQSALLKKKFS